MEGVSRDKNSTLSHNVLPISQTLASADISFSASNSTSSSTPYQVLFPDIP